MVKPKSSIVKVYFDEHDKNASNFFKDYIKTRNPDLLLNASSEFLLSSNPEKSKISILCKGLYYREKGKQEKNDIKAKKLLLKSMSTLKLVETDDKVVKEVELEFIKRKLHSYDKNKDKVDIKLFLRSAILHRDLGHEKAYNLEMSLYYLFFITDNQDTLLKKDILEKADLMLKHAEKGEEPEQLHKTKALYHQIKANQTFDKREALEELGKAITETKLTSDKFHLGVTETEYLMTKAMTTANSKARNVLLKDVAIRYRNQGDKVKENFVQKMLSPMPIKAVQVISLANQSLNKLRILETTISKIKGDKKGPFVIFYHLGYMLERIEDTKRILLRMALARKEITDLNIKESAMRPRRTIPQKLNSSSLQKIIVRNNELTKQIRQDMESLYIYGNLLLDQWSYLIGYIAGYEIPDKSLMEPSFYFEKLLSLFGTEESKQQFKELWKQNKNKILTINSEVNFAGLLTLLQNHKYDGELKEFWNKHRNDIIWLNFHLRYFRNVFIEHLRKPWQRGTTMGVYGDDFTLHIPSAVGYVKPDEVKKTLKEIYPLAPQRLKDMPDDYWGKKNLHSVLETTMYFIDEIEKQSDRDKVWSAWNKLGGSTASYDTIGYRLFNYIDTSIDTMIKFVEANPKLLKLGKF